LLEQGRVAAQGSHHAATSSTQIKSSIRVCVSRWDGFMALAETIPCKQITLSAVATMP
jgi:hypothetical protein